MLKRWEQKELVRDLRQRGLSYREILVRVPFTLSRSTISQWCKDIELTPEQLDRLDQLKSKSWYRNRLKGSKTTQRRRAEVIATIRSRARTEVPALTKKELWLAGLMLYWAEGGKKRDVSFSNSDVSAVRFMMRWFRDICRVPEEGFRIHLNIHSGQDDAVIKEFWSGVTGVPIPQFAKSYVKREGTGHRKNILYHGTAQIRICNRDLFHTIQGWIEGISEKISGPLAQSVEQVALNDKVTGSIPVRPKDLDDIGYVMDRGAAFQGHVAELGDAQDLGSCPKRGGGSTPSVPIGILLVG